MLLSQLLVIQIPIAHSHPTTGDNDTDEEEDDDDAEGDVSALARILYFQGKLLIALHYIFYSTG
jgi:hypothetical protein